MRKVFLTVTLFVLVRVARAQDGNAGINEANTQVRSYFEAGTNLMYAVGAILGLIGAVKVYQKWNAGDHDTGKTAAAWFGLYVALMFESFSLLHGETLFINRHILMKNTRISRRTYNKCMKQLHQYGYIRYEPSCNPAKRSKVCLRKL